MGIPTEFSTQRLYIRHLNEQDWVEIYEYLSDPEVVYYEPYPPMTRHECRDVITNAAKTGSFWVVLLARSGKLIGQVFLEEKECRNWEVGYVFNRLYHGNGYVREAVKKLVDFVFSHKNAHRVFANCNPANTASWRLLEAVGFRQEARLLKNVFFKQDNSGDPLWQDTYIYGILREDLSTI